MTSFEVSDDELLAGHDGASFALFYRRHVEAMLGFFSRRTHDAELAADLTAETFAAALAGRAQYRPEVGGGGELAVRDRDAASSSTRSGGVPRSSRARQTLGRGAHRVDDGGHCPYRRVGRGPGRGAVAGDARQPDQREAVRAHVVDERSYEEIAERGARLAAVVRKRVSRGLAVVRQRMGNHR